MSATTETPTPPPPAAPPRRFETRHRGSFGGSEIAYRCVAGETHLPDAKGEPRASIFSFSYLADADDATRPVTFTFNGGPGSASLWLHMGALGPRRIVVPSDATPAPAPYAVIDNPLCPLDRTDLVFIDPPGTGYSRMLGAAKPEDAWGLDADADVVAEFIKAWLTAERRWASPRFLCGESYGTTRAVAVAGKLAGGLAGVGFNGLALISAILDSHTIRFERGNPLPDVCFLPTYAATALHYGLAEAPDGRDAFLDEVRAFAVEEYLPALVAGSGLAASRRARVLRKLARVTGLNETWLERTRLRIDPARFRKELLREQGLTVGRFDTRYTGRDYDEAGEAPDSDASSYAIDSAYVTAMNDHLTRVLGIDWNKPYVAFNREVITKWDWFGPRKDDQPRWPGCVNVAPTLGRLLREQPGLRVLVANGIFDLATPFYAVETTIAGNGIDAARVKMTYYDAGHMMYLHELSLAALLADLRKLIG
jgi:carboxypeptidase C (cathepsin A)